MTGGVSTRLRRHGRALLEHVGLLAAAPGDNTYHAFISYSHAVDSRLAPALQRGLQRFAKPWYRPRALRVFRDETGLAANPHLWASIAAALDASRYFILLASAEAAQSPWVAREIAHWCTTKPPTGILIALTDGELHWDSAGNDFDRQGTTALPPELRGAFSEEPRWIDLRWARNADDLSLSHPQFRNAIAELAAPLHDKPKEELASEEVRQHRRTLRVARSAAVTLLALTGAAVFLAVLALGERAQALSARDATISTGAAAEARSRLAAGKLDQGVLLALEAAEAAKTPQAEDVLASVALSTNAMIGFLNPRQSDSIWSVAFSPDGKALASASVDDTVSVWNTASRRQMRLFRVAALGATAVSFSPNGRRLASGGVGPLVLRDLAGGRSHARLPLPSSGLVDALSFSPNGETLDSANSSGGVYVADLAHPGRYTTLQRGGASGSNFLNAFSADGRMLASADLNSGTVTVWDVAAGHRVDVLDYTSSSAISAVAFGPDDKTLVVAHNGGAIAVWDLRSSSLRWLAGPPCVHRVAVSSDGRTLAEGCGDGRVDLLDLASGTLLTTLRCGGGVITALAFDPRATVLASGSSDGTVVLWDVGRATGPLPTHRESAAAVRVAFSPDGQRLAAVGGQGAVLVWEVAHPDRPLMLRTGSRMTFRAVAFNATGTAVDAVGFSDPGADRSLVSWTLSRQRRPVTFRLRGSASEFSPPTFSQDGSTLAAPVSSSGSGVDVLVWDIGAHLGPSFRLRGRGNDVLVQSLAFSVDGSKLAAAEQTLNGVRLEPGSRVTVWDLAHRRRIATFDGGRLDYSSVAFRPDGNTLAASGSGLTLWDVKRGSRSADLISTPFTASPVRIRVAFSPDGKLLAASAGSEVTLWDLADLKPFATITSGEPVADPVFSPGGGLLAAGSQQGSVMLWDVAAAQSAIEGHVNDLEKLLCPRIGRNLSRAEWSEFFPNRAYHRTCGSVPAAG